MDCRGGGDVLFQVGSRGDQSSDQEVGMGRGVKLKVTQLKRKMKYKCRVLPNCHVRGKKDMKAY